MTSPRGGAGSSRLQNAATTYREEVLYAIVVGLAALGLGAIWSTANETHAIVGFTTDHMRHAYAAWSFLQIGFDVYRQPISAWNVAARHPHPLHKPLPHNYPPGSILLFLPFGVLANLGIIADSTVHALETSLFLLSGAAVPVLATRFWRGDEILGIGVAAFLGVQALWAGGNGMFDAIVLVPLLPGIYWYKKEEYRKALVALTVAFSLHFRAWWIGPIALATAWRYVRSHGIDTVLVGSGAVGALSLFSFALARRTLSTERASEHWGWNNPFVLFHGADALGYLLAVAIIVGIAVLWAYGEDYVTLATTGLAFVMVLFLPQWFPWYYVLFGPVLFVPDTKVGRLVVGLGSIEVAMHLPDPTGAFRYVLQSLAAIA